MSSRPFRSSLPERALSKVTRIAKRMVGGPDDPPRLTCHHPDRTWVAGRSRDGLAFLWVVVEIWAALQVSERSASAVVAKGLACCGRILP